MAFLVAQCKESSCNAGDWSLIPGWGRSPGEGNDNSLQYSCLENPMDGGAWWATVQGVAKSRTWLSDFTSLSLTINRHEDIQQPKISYVAVRISRKSLVRTTHGSEETLGYWSVQGCPDTTSSAIYCNRTALFQCPSKRALPLACKC